MASKKHAREKSPKKKKRPAQKPSPPKKKRPPAKKKQTPKKRSPAKKKRPPVSKKQTPKKRPPAKKRPRKRKKNRDQILRKIRENLQELNSEEFRDVFKDMIERRQEDLFAGFIELPVKGLDGLLIDEEIEALKRLREAYDDTGSIDSEAASIAADWGIDIREVYTFWIYNGVAA